MKIRLLQVGAGVHQLGVPGHEAGLSGPGASRGDQEADISGQHCPRPRHVETDF